MSEANEFGQIEMRSNFSVTKWNIIVTGGNEWRQIIYEGLRPNGVHLLRDVELFGYSAITPFLNPINIAIMSMTKVENLNGMENSDDCMIKLLKKANCSVICLPLFANHLNKIIPFCATSQDYLCMKNYYDEVGKPWMPCYDEKQKSITKITEGHIRRGAFKNNDIFTYLDYEDYYEYDY